MFMTLIRWLWFLNPYILYVFPVVLFIILGKRMRMMILLYCTISTYDMITSLCMKLGLYLHTALRSFPYIRSYVLEFGNNQTQAVGKTRGDNFLYSFTTPLSLRLVLRLLRISSTHGMLRPALSFCYASWMGFRFCLGLNK